MDLRHDDANPIPWRTILATIGCVIAAALALIVLRALARIVTWMVVAAFFAIVLQPIVDRLQQHTRLRRGTATSLVFFGSIFAVLGLLALFVIPVGKQAPNVVNDLPETVRLAGEGKGPVGDIVTRLHLVSFVKSNAPKIQELLDQLGDSSLKLLRSVFDTLLAVVTILVLTFLFLLDGPRLQHQVQRVIPDRHRERVNEVAHQATRAISGYMIGNLIISLFAGAAALILLLALGVPHAGLLALWVAFADLIPLVGATLGAIVAVLAAFLHSATAGVISGVFFLAYQQFENHVLQLRIMARTVKVRPLVTLISILVGVELFGFLGALLAIPAAGVLQVVGKAWWKYRHDEPVTSPTDLGADPGPEPGVAT